MKSIQYTGKGSVQFYSVSRDVFDEILSMPYAMQPEKEAAIMGEDEMYDAIRNWGEDHPEWASGIVEICNGGFSPDLFYFMRG